MRTAVKTLDYSRVLVACGYDGRNGNEKRGVNARIRHFLEQTPAAAMAEFREKIASTAENLRKLPLNNYRGEDAEAAFKAAWCIAKMPPPLADWNYLSHTNPEKCGILCGNPNAEPVLFTEDDVCNMGLPEETGVVDLWLNLSWWREAVCAVWAGKIAHQLIHLWRGGSLLLSSGDNFLQGTGIEKRARGKSDLLGMILELPGVSHVEAAEFYAACDAAAMGSMSCEYDAADAFKEWLRSASIGVFQKHGLTFEEAHYTLLSGSQSMPQMEITMEWNDSVGAYQFACIVKNRNAHGYPDKKKTSRIPQELLLSFYEGASREIRIDLSRLLLRAGMQKMRELLRKTLDSRHN